MLEVPEGALNDARASSALFSFSLKKMLGSEWRRRFVGAGNGVGGLRVSGDDIRTGCSCRSIVGTFMFYRTGLRLVARPIHDTRGQTRGGGQIEF